MKAAENAPGAEQDLQGVAVIGMAGRFPKADNINAFWRNIEEGVECISFFSAEELQQAGVDLAWLEAPNFVNARAILEGADRFDAAFFGLTPREAELTDPQQRLFLECAWEALEHAGCDPARYDGLIGVYAGADTNAYAVANLLRGVRAMQSFIGNDKDYLATRVAFKLNLKGPALTIQTACSTSLVAVQLACEGLLNYQTDIALAGGVGIAFPQQAGYWYEEGGILSPDGHCRAFDAKARGTVGGDGVGIVVLKRYEDALKDGDGIHAVIKGAAINNDGSLKVGFTAPSVEGQADVIAMALAAADVEPETISYIEAHGTGTELGDPIEIAALTEVFRSRTDDKQFCAIGALKTNVGHMNSAAGIGGLLKTVLALKHKRLPPSLHFEQPNPRIDFANSPFYVNARSQPWPAGNAPRRAGVSSFGIGGTNAHVVLEEAPVAAPSGPSRSQQLLVLSAKSAAALDAATANLAAYLEQEVELADVAYTLLVGRQLFQHRRLLVCQNRADALSALRQPQRLSTVVREPKNATVAFLFPGQGAQYVNMAKQLYHAEPELRQVIDYCADYLKPQLQFDLRDLLYPEDAATNTATLQQTAITQPALFVTEYALAKLWMSWGVTPQAMIGHSIGEYVAACLAGVFSLEDALDVVAARGRLIQRLPPGAMLAAAVSEPQAHAYREVSVAAINAPGRCVLSGAADAIAELEKQLTTRGVSCQILATSHGFHSQMMEPILAEFEAIVGEVPLNAPQIPYISNVSGSWINAAEATDPGYWARHIRLPVRFAQGVAELLQEPDRVLLEVGPGQTLASLVNQQAGADRVVLTTLRHPRDNTADLAFLLQAVGQLYCADIALDWSAFYSRETRRKVPLPSYPFERERYWLAPNQDFQPGVTPDAATGKKPEVAEWLYLPFWKPAPLPRPQHSDEAQRWLVFSDESALVAALIDRLRKTGRRPFIVTTGAAFSRLGDDGYRLDPESRDHYHSLLQDLATHDHYPDKIVHLWSLTAEPVASGDGFEKSQYRGFYSLLFLTQALTKSQAGSATTIDIITHSAVAVTGGECLRPENATLLGLSRVIPLEHSDIACRSIDVASPESSPQGLTDRLLAELDAPVTATKVAYRGNTRWVEAFEPLKPGAETRAFRKQGVYLVTGGLGNIGLIIADYLAATVQAKLVLVGRTGLPAREEWSSWRESHHVNDKISLRISKIQELEASGAEVLVLSADVADVGQMQAVIAKAGQRFGRLHGVFHCAGSVEPALLHLIQDTDLQLCQLHFGCKVQGVYTLAEVLPKDLDFCLLCSSLATSLGLIGGSAYTAANGFMDAFVHQHNRDSATPWVSVNWDGWRAPQPSPLDKTVNFLGRFAIQPEEGIEALRRILSLDAVSQILVSTQDLPSRMKQLHELKARLATGESIPRDSASRHPRPELDTEYVAPRDDMENLLADLWQDILGIEKIGVYDNFFKLGGDSLIAIQLSLRLRDTFQIEFSVHNLFDDPTIAGQAEKIRHLQETSQQDTDDIAEKLALVENLSDQEVKEMLALLGADQNPKER